MTKSKDPNSSLEEDKKNEKNEKDGKNEKNEKDEKDENPEAIRKIKAGKNPSRRVTGYHYVTDGEGKKHRVYDNIDVKNNK